MLLSLKLWSLRCPHWHQKYQIFYLWLDTIERTEETQTKEMQPRRYNVRFSLRALLAALVFFFLFFLGWIKTMRKILLLLLETCTCTDAQILTEREYWRQRDEKWEKSKRKTSTKLLINQGVDVRFQNMWWVEYQRVKD